MFAPGIALEREEVVVMVDLPAAVAEVVRARKYHLG
jgi:hypothetical protein